MSKTSYSLIDSGEGEKLEDFGGCLISRPSSTAVWRKQHPNRWADADLFFSREKDPQWKTGKREKKLKNEWDVEIEGITFTVAPTDFGHLGLFPEHSFFWPWMQKKIVKAEASRSEPIKVLNLFAYSGGATLAAAKAGAEVCHLDASKPMVLQAKQNALKNHLQQAPIRWIVDDVMKFLKREMKRKSTYHGIILDPPTFGRGTKNEVFKIEKEINKLLDLCFNVLVKKPLFVLFTCHTPSFTPSVLQNLLEQMMSSFSGTIDQGEMFLPSEEAVLPLPSGNYARWQS